MTESNSENQNGINKPEITVENIGQYYDKLEKKLSERGTPWYASLVFLYTVDLISGDMSMNDYILELNSLAQDMGKLDISIEKYNQEKAELRKQELKTVAKIYEISRKNPYTLEEMMFITHEDKLKALCEEIKPYLH